MNRKDKEMTDPTEVAGVLRRATVCRLAMTDGDRPYVVPLCYGYADDTLYFHSAGRGKKLDILRKNPKVCFEMEMDAAVLPKETPCQWTMRCQSVIGYGEVTWIDEEAEKRRILDLILSRYGGTGPFEYPSRALAKVTVFSVYIREISGKRSG